MNKARTEYDRGKINNKFQQFASDYGFKVHPCIAGRPRTKAKVEAPMKILDEIRAYNGKLNYRELVELVTKINNRVNSQVNQGTGRIPLLYFEKEKAFLRSLPADNVRKPYQITTNMNFNEWDGVFYDAVVANAIMDRILHHAHVIPISGKSYRLKDHLKSAD